MLLKGGRAAVDALHRRAFGQRAASVYGLAQDVEHASQGSRTNGHPDGVSRHVYRKAALQALVGGKHDAPHPVFPHVLGHFHYPHCAVLFHSELLPQPGQRPLYLYIDDGTGYLHDNSFFQIPHLPFFWRWALAPADTSVISWVIADCRTRLYWRDSSPKSFSAFWLALSIAVMRASCSQQKLSIRAL